MGLRAKVDACPPAVLSRHLAATCVLYNDDYRIEQFFSGHTLSADDVFDPNLQRRIADELYRLHDLDRQGLPDATFFELLHENSGGPLAPCSRPFPRGIPPDEQAMCLELQTIYSPDTMVKVMRCLPNTPPVF